MNENTKEDFVVDEADKEISASSSTISESSISTLAEYKSAEKRYVFNETGNILLMWTEMDTEKVPESVGRMFAAVAKFYTEMIKSISNSINPDTNKPYSIYNYEAIQNVIDGSGLFVQVTEEDIVYKTTSFGNNFSKQLIRKVLGLHGETGELSFAQGMITSIGNVGLKMASRSKASDNRVANIIFTCEYLLGMPIVSAVVVSCDVKKNEQIFKLRPCSKQSATSIALTIHKDVYSFVVPELRTQSTNQQQNKDKGENYGK